jgi:flagellar hook-associated protein 1 FlgK
MGNLFVSLLNSSNALRLFQRGLGVVENNVSNVQTAGYAKQRMELQADRFQPEVGLPGGVSLSAVVDSRDEFAERNVRRQLEGQAYSAQQEAGLSALEPVLSIQDKAGVGGAMNRLMQSFSALGVAPNDTAARQVALDRAGELALSVRRTADSLAAAQHESDRDLRTSLGELQAVGERLRELNAQFRSDFRAQKDAGLNAQLHTALEQLSELTDASVLREDDGSVTVYLGGQTLFLLGENLYPVQAEFTNEEVRLTDAEGADITGRFQGGKIGALLDLRNEAVPGFQRDLDRLAAGIADAVNGTLAGGVDMNGQPPAMDLFAYDANLGAARTLSVNALAPAELALAEATAPGGNANALALAGLDESPAVDGFTFSEYYGNLAARLGRALASSREELQTQQSLVSQARAWREEVSGVNLDEEAVMLMQYQRAFEAATKMVMTLNDMTQELMGLIR